MPLAKREFCLGLAEIYRFGTVLLDENRSVQIRRRIDSRIPHPLLSAAAPVAPPKRSLGGLVDLKKPTTLAPNPLRPASSTAVPSARSWSNPATPRLSFAASLTTAATPAATSSSASNSPRPSPSTTPRPPTERVRTAIAPGLHLSAYVPPHQRTTTIGTEEDIVPDAPDWDEE